MTLVGNQTHTLDAKNRVFFPAKYREIMGSPIMITCNLDGCLSAFSVAEWEKYTEKVRSIPPEEGYDFKQIIFANAQWCTPDGQGRVSLTKSQVEYAKITGEVTFVGNDDHVRLWASEDPQLESIINPKSLEEHRKMMRKYGV